MGIHVNVTPPCGCRIAFSGLTAWQVGDIPLSIAFCGQHKSLNELPLSGAAHRILADAGLADEPVEER